MDPLEEPQQKASEGLKGTPRAAQHVLHQRVEIEQAVGRLGEDAALLGPGEDREVQRHRATRGEGDLTGVEGEEDMPSRSGYFPPGVRPGRGAGGDLGEDRLQRRHLPRLRTLGHDRVGDDREVSIFRCDPHQLRLELQPLGRQHRVPRLHRCLQRQVHQSVVQKRRVIRINTATRRVAVQIEIPGNKLPLIPAIPRRLPLGLALGELEERHLQVPAREVVHTLAERDVEALLREREGAGDADEGLSAIRFDDGGELDRAVRDTPGRPGHVVQVDPLTVDGDLTGGIGVIECRSLCGVSQCGIGRLIDQDVGVVLGLGVEGDVLIEGGEGNLRHAPPAVTGEGQPHLVTRVGVDRAEGEGGGGGGVRGAETGPPLARAGRYGGRSGGRVGVCGIGGGCVGGGGVGRVDGSGFAGRGVWSLVGVRGLLDGYTIAPCRGVGGRGGEALVRVFPFHRGSLLRTHGLGRRLGLAAVEHPRHHQQTHHDRKDRDPQAERSGRRTLNGRRCDGGVRGRRDGGER